MKVFITGGTGFIGSYIVKDLLDHGHEVTILARNPQKVSGFLNNNRIRFVQGAIDNKSAISEGLKGQDACIHVALAWGVTAETMLSNETATSVWLFEAAALGGVKKLIFTSSIAAFGSAPNTDSGYTKPTDYYGATKAATESYLMAIANKHQIQGNVVRPGYTFGNPCVDGAFIYTDVKIKDMVKNALAGNDMTFVKNDGTQFIWAGDLAKIYTSVLESDLNRGYFTGVSAEYHTWGQIAEMVVAITGSKSKVIYEDKGRKAHDGLPIDVSEIKKAFGYSFVIEEHMKDHIKYLTTIV